MTRIAALLVLAFPAAGLAVEKYSPKGGQYSVHLPGRPKEATHKARTALGELQVVTATYATATGDVYLVSYTEYPEGTVKASTRGTIFDGARDGLKGKDGKVLSEKDVEIGPEKLPGRDIVIEKDDQRLRFRLVLRDDRLFQVAVIGSPKFTASREAEVFLESFEVTK